MSVIVTRSLVLIALEQAGEMGFAHLSFHIFDKKGDTATIMTRVLPNDDAALTEAKKIVRDGAMEIWRDAHKVAHLDPPPGRLTVTQMRERQSAKIWELRAALVTAGIFTLDEQAEVLGLSRSTAWTILNGHNKTGGLSAPTINRILGAPRLPAFVRAKILEFIDEKAAGLYGHSEATRRKFIAQRLILDSSNTPFCNGRRH